MASSATPLCHSSRPSFVSCSDSATSGSSATMEVLQCFANVPSSSSTEALPRGAGEPHMDRLVGQPVVAIALRDAIGKHRADGAVDVADRHLDGDLLAALERRRGELDESIVERLLEAVALRLAVMACDF